jgi:hypothetical protein
MCPACAASAALVAGSVVSGGGLTALVARILRMKIKEKKNNQEEQQS